MAIFGLLALGVFGAGNARAQEAEAEAEADVEDEIELSDEEAEALFMEHIEEFGWVREGRGELGSTASIAIPEGYRFTGKDGTAKLMDVMGNPPSPDRFGVLAPENLDWFVVFAYEEMGYVKDDEKDDLDADEMLAAFQESQVASNHERESIGMEKMYVEGWAKKPFYNEDTNNLEWALRLRDESGNISVNYKTKLLGRYGVMDSILVCGAEELDSLLPTYQSIITDFDYKPGNTYAEYQKGDKIAEYGLKGLMIGGGAFVAAKLGFFGFLMAFLKKGWVLIVAAIVGIKTWLSKVFSRGKSQYTVDQ